MRPTEVNHIRLSVRVRTTGLVHAGLRQIERFIEKLDNPEGLKPSRGQNRDLRRKLRERASPTQGARGRDGGSWVTSSAS